MLTNIKPVIYTPQKLCEAFFWTKTNKILEQAQVNLIYQDSEDFKMNRNKRFITQNWSWIFPVRNFNKMMVNKENRVS